MISVEVEITVEEAEDLNILLKDIQSQAADLEQWIDSETKSHWWRGKVYPKFEDVKEWFEMNQDPALLGFSKIDRGYHISSNTAGRLKDILHLASVSSVIQIGVDEAKVLAKVRRYDDVEDVE